MRNKILAGAAATGAIVLGVGAPAFAGTDAGTTPTSFSVTYANAGIANTYYPGGTAGAATVPVNVTVKWSGFTPQQNLYFDWCTKDGNAPGAIFSSASDCDPTVANFSTAQADIATGSGSRTFKILVGENELFGSPIMCQPANWPKLDVTFSGVTQTSQSTCYVRVTQGVKTNVADDFFVPITLTDGNGGVVPEVPYAVLLPLGAALVMGGALVVSRRRGANAA